MRTAKHNFRIDEKGIRGQLNRIAAILERGDPELYRHLSEIGAGDCIFAYRMVVVLFRRELSFEQTLGLWEVGILFLVLLFLCFYVLLCSLEVATGIVDVEGPGADQCFSSECILTCVLAYRMVVVFFGRELGFEQTLGPLGGGDENAPLVYNLLSSKFSFVRWHKGKGMLDIRVSALYRHQSMVGARGCIFVY
jgi:hypothetical protein